jgi:hypothetical protein
MDIPHQRKGADSNTQVGNDFELLAKKYLERTLLAQFKSNHPIDIGIHDRKKAHRFDLVDVNKKILVECKAHTWTEGGNIPSAKITNFNQAMYYFHASPEGYRKILFIHKSVCPKRNRSLGRYYIDKNDHLIPLDVEIWEYDAVDDSHELLEI